MANTWNGYSNGEIPLNAMAELQGQYFQPAMFQCMVDLVNRCAAQGVNIHINEGYRPLGVPSDQYAANETQTASGGSSQWFQLGRANRGETPSAATPGQSSHGLGIAADISPGRDNAVVRSVAETLGLSFPITSESWHVVLGSGGSSSAQSVDIQKLLNAHGYDLVVDGILGPKSLAAIKDFQRTNGLVVDGVVGLITLAALQAQTSSGGDVAGTTEVQTLLNAFGYGLTVDGISGPATRSAVKDFQAKNGLAVDGIVGPATTAKLRQGVPAPTPPAPTPPAPPVKPVQPAKPTRPAKPANPPKPVKDNAVTPNPLPDTTIAAQTDSLGILIPNPKARRLVYALYGLAALIVSNISVAVMASGTQAPVWLIVTTAICGNLAVPFTTLAIANASNKK